MRKNEDTPPIMAPPPKSTYAPLLVVLLIVASYFLGMLTTKVQYLEASKTAPTDSEQALGAKAPAPQKVTVDNGHLPILGDEDAKITIVEFSDFQCPFCKQFNDNAYTQIKDEYIKKGVAKLAFRHFPLPFHQNAQKAAEASECANEQQKFWEYHDILFKNQELWANQSTTDVPAAFNSYAATIGIDGQRFTECLTSERYKQKVLDDVAAGQKAGITGTPSFTINGTLLVGAQPFTAFKQLFDQLGK